MIKTFRQNSRSIHLQYCIYTFASKGQVMTNPHQPIVQTNINEASHKKIPRILFRCQSEIQANRKDTSRLDRASVAKPSDGTSLGTIGWGLVHLWVADMDEAAEVCSKRWKILEVSPSWACKMQLKEPLVFGKPIFPLNHLFVVCMNGAPLLEPAGGWSGGGSFSMALTGAPKG